MMIHGYYSPLGCNPTAPFAPDRFAVVLVLGSHAVANQVLLPDSICLLFSARMSLCGLVAYLKQIHPA